MPATHTEKCWALSTHALIGRLAGKMEMKADRKLTYAYNTHEDTFMELCMRTHTHAFHTPTQQHCSPAFLPYFCWSSSMSSSAHGCLCIMLLNSAPIPNDIFTCSDCQSFSVTHCAALTKWSWCLLQAMHSCGVVNAGQVYKDGVKN